MKRSMEQVSDALLEVYPVLGGVSLSSRCKYVVDPAGSAVRASSTERQSRFAPPQIELRNKHYCDAQFKKYNGSSKSSEFYRAFAHQWEGRMRGAETLDGRKHAPAELLNREFACNTLSASWAPHACGASAKLVDATPWLPFCTAFAYFYNGHYKILNKFVALLDLCNDTPRAVDMNSSCTGDNVSRVFAANYNFLMANGPLRWNYATPGEMLRSSDCSWASWSLPDRGDTWRNSGLPGQFWAEVATQLDQGLSSMPGLPFPLTVYKGMESDPLYFCSLENNINRSPGETFMLNGFNSTTLDVDIALEYAHPVETVRGVFVFNLPVGTLCHYKHDNTNPTYQVLLPRKRVFRVSRTSTFVRNGETYRFIFCDLLNPADASPNLQLDLGLPADCALLPSSSMPWALRLYEMYWSLTMCDPPVVSAAEYAEQPPIPLLYCYLQLQQLAIASGECIGTCPFIDVSSPPPPQPQPQPQPPPGTQHLTVYRVVEQGDTGGLSNGNSADLEGQLSYTALSLPRRHADWDTRIMQKYNVDYMPLNQCGESESSVCPPFGVYAKCNPGGCASGTNCSTDANCPGEGGVCTGGQCVCCGPNNICSVDRECGTGKCTEGKCVCTGIDQSYKCNVAEYPEYTNSVMGDTQHVGAIPAPFDASNYPKGAWAPQGFWYSTPEPGLCKPGQTLGEGCSWSTTGVDKQYTIGELSDRGFKVYCDPKKNPGKKCSSKKEVMMSQRDNLNILNNLFN